MTDQPIHHEESDSNLNQFAGELLEVLLQEEAPYPWNPADPETEAYFTELEQSFSLLDSGESDAVASEAETFFSHLHQCWATSGTARVQNFLAERFGDCVPTSWLEAIVHQAEQIVAVNLTPLHQLVECVRPLLSNWTDEDLQVFARPLVYAMRGQVYVQQAPWNELSEIDKVRLSMVIAKDALGQLEAENSK